MKQTCWHYISGLRCWTGSRIREPEVLGKVPGTVHNVLKSRIIRKESACRCRRKTGSGFAKPEVVAKRRKRAWKASPCLWHGRPGRFAPVLRDATMTDRPSAPDRGRERAGDSLARRPEADRQLRSAFRASPLRCHPLSTPDVSSEPFPRCRPIVRRRLWWCEDGPEWRRRPLPIAPSPARPVAIWLRLCQLLWDR